MSRVAEVSAELPLYRIMIGVAEILGHYSTVAIAETEATL
jgi:hypothetical protein